jgi:hypothetical protein
MRTHLKAFVGKVPLVGPFLGYLYKGPGYFKTSSDYWDRRYRAGGTSGSGSYNRLAEFKASVLNRFVVEHQITSLIEYGSGDGAQLTLALYPSYIGVDVSAKAVEMCRILFAGDGSKRFLESDAVPPGVVADLSLSLDVIYHLVEDSAYDAYMQRLFDSGRRFVIVYSSNMDQDWPRRHVRHRQFTHWIDQNRPEWYLHSSLKNAYPYDPADPEHTSFAEFYVFAPRSTTSGYYNL